MKKIIFICLVVLAVIASAFLAFDSSSTPSTNNEGIKKPDIAVSEPAAAFLLIFKNW